MSERWVDVSHEALIRGWPRLRGWIEEDRTGLRLHRRLTEAAQEWQKGGDDGVLYRGARLAQAIEWRDRQDASLNELERSFLDAGVALERREAEARDRRRRRVIVWLSLSLVVFAVLAGLAGLKWRQAYEQGQVALAGKLGNQAVLLRDDPKALFLRPLLAAEAMKRLRAVEVQSLEVDLALRRELASLPRHVARWKVENWHDDVLFSPDGRNLVAGDLNSRNATVWEIATRRELVRFEGGLAGELTATLPGKVVRFQVEGVAGRNHMPVLTGDGKYFVTEADDGSEPIAQVWATETGAQLLRLQQPGSHQYALSEDGRYLAASTSTFDPAKRTHSDPVTSVWDVRAQRELPGSAPGSVLAFSHDGSVLATSTALFGVTAGLPQIFSWEHDSFNVVLSGDGGHVAVWTERAGQQQIEIWSKAAKKRTFAMPAPTPDERIQAVTSDGRYVILSDSQRRETQVHDMAAGALVSSAILPVRAAAVTPSGQYLAASLLNDDNERENAVDVWAPGEEGGDVLAIPHRGEVVAAGLTPRGGLATIARDGEKLLIRSWDIRTRKEASEPYQATGTAARFAPDGQTFAFLGDGGLEVRRIGEPEPVARFAYSGATGVVWSPDGRYLAAQKDRDVRVWDLRSRQSIGDLALPGLPTRFALARGGDSLAAVISSGESTRSGVAHHAKLWNVATGEELKSFELDKKGAIRSDTHCALSPDAQYLVTRALKVMEMKTGMLLPTKLGLAENETDCVMSFDGRYLATSSEGMARLWEMGSGREVSQIPGNGRPLIFDQDFRYLATVEGSTVRVWPLRQDDLIEEACKRLPRNLTEEEWRRYVGGDYRKTCPNLP